ncbi:unnamed protein product [Absidia cylindrospora]
MQSMPYYQPSYPQAPQYPPAGSPAGVMPTGPPMLGHLQHHDPMGQPAKRKQVKNACTNCQKACKKCDDARPCPRCVKYGIADSCVNSVRKERKKGIKRGPYKRRQKSESEKSSQPKREDQGPYGNMRAPPIPYGFPGNLNQYGQPAYDYNAAHYYKEQMAQYNVVNPMYPQMGYPVLMQGQNESSPQQQQQQQQQQPHANAYQQQQHSSLPQHYGNMVQQPQQQQQQPTYQNQSASPQQAHASPQLYNPQQQQQQHQPTLSAQHSPDIKASGLTPMPSASTSTGTSSSPPGSAVGEDDKSKYGGLSQLCTAALHQEPSGQDQSAAHDSAQQ